MQFEQICVVIADLFKQTLSTVKLKHLVDYTSQGRDDTVCVCVFASVRCGPPEWCMSALRATVCV